MAQQVRRLGADLHEPDLADVADRPGIVGALNLSHGIGHVRRQPSAFRLAADQGQVRAAATGLAPRHADQSLDGGRRRRVREGRRRGRIGQGRRNQHGEDAQSSDYSGCPPPPNPESACAQEGKPVAKWPAHFMNTMATANRKGLEDGGSPSPSAWPYVQAEDALANTA